MMYGRLGCSIFYVFGTGVEKVKTNASILRNVIPVVRVELIYVESSQ